MEVIHPNISPEQRSGSKNSLLLQDYLNEVLSSLSNQLKQREADRREFLLIVSNFMSEIRKRPILVLDIKNLEEFEKFISGFKRIEKNCGVEEDLENLREKWGEQSLYRLKQQRSYTTKMAESHFLGQIKGKGVEKFITEALISINSKLKDIKFIKAPLLDDLIGAGDIYMAIQLENELVIFPVDITAAIEKQASLYKLAKDSGNYPFSLVFDGNLNIYRIELALNDKNFWLSLDEIESIIEIGLALFKEELRKHRIDAENIKQNIKQFIQRIKQSSDPRYNKGVIDLATFIETFIQRFIPYQELNQFFAGLYCLYSIYWILENLPKNLPPEDKERIKKCRNIIENHLNLNTYQLTA
jgi:hypothetical protein